MTFHALFCVRYPGVQVDILASDRGKQTFELNKNVRWANVYDPDDEWPDPAEYTDMVGLLKVGGFEVQLIEYKLIHMFLSLPSRRNTIN